MTQNATNFIIALPLSLFYSYILAMYSNNTLMNETKPINNEPKAIDPKWYLTPHHIPLIKLT